ncbi:hypothetical protein [Kineococcus arenarius]
MNPARAFTEHEIPHSRTRWQALHRAILCARRSSTFVATVFTLVQIVVK